MDLYKAAKEKFPTNIIIALVIGIVLGYFIATAATAEGASGQSMFSKFVQKIVVKQAPAPVINTPKGYHDYSGCDYSSGWTCDADNYNQALQVHFYADKPAGAPSAFINYTTANVAREAAVGANCGGNSAHGFKFITPNSLKDGKKHTIYAYAINIGSGTVNPLLSNSPKTINCTAPKTSCSDSDNGKNYNVKGRTTGNWAGQYGTYTDICDGSTLKEYYCEDTPTPHVVLQNQICSYGCSNGACLKAPLTAAKIDLIPPAWNQTPKNRTILSGAALRYDLNASDNINISRYFINDTKRFKINQTTGLLQNKTALLPGNYSLKISVNDTSGKINSTVIKITVK